MSTGEGCGAKGCHCSDRYWLSIAEPAKIIHPENQFGSIVEGIKVKFDNEEEMDIFLRDHEILGAD